MASSWSRRGPGGRPTRPVVSVRDAASWLRDYLTAIKHGQFHPFTPIERKTREATRNEAWGPTGTLLNELAEASGQSDYCQIIYAVLEARLNYPPEKWRNVYKGLQVLEFLIKRGSDECVMLAQADLRPYVQNVKNFDYIGPDGRDYGINVRVRADAIVRLLDSEQELKQERAQLQRRAKQFKGFSREDMENNEVLGDLAPRSNSWAGSTRNDDGAAHEHSNFDEEVHGQVEMAKHKRAGEMKGVSEAENKKLLRLLKVQLANKGNRRCADCLGSERPSWASINCGVFLCMKCAGIHRGLGVHVSQVRSCTLDTWLPEQVKFMSQTGNRIANSYWEAKLPPNLKPGPDDPNLGRFIRRKYENREWADGPWPPPRDSSSQNENTLAEASSASSTSGTARPAGLRIAKHPSMRSTKPPLGVARQWEGTADSPFEAAADWSSAAGGHSDWAASANADQQAPMSSLAMNPFAGGQGATMPRTISYPNEDLMHFGDSGDFGSYASQAASQQQLPQGTAQPRVQLMDMLYESGRGGRQRGFTEPLEGVIRTTELRIEDDDVIHTTELILDDLDAGMAKPALSSADGILQSTSDYPEFSSFPWLESDMKGAFSSSLDRGPQSAGINAGQNQDLHSGSRAHASGSVTPDSDTPHVSVIITVNNKRGRAGSAPVPAAQPTQATAPTCAHQSMLPVNSAQPSMPAYQSDVPSPPLPSAAAPTSARDPLDELSSTMHTDLMDAPVQLSWGSSRGGTVPQAHSTNPFAGPPPVDPSSIPKGNPWGQPAPLASPSPVYSSADPYFMGSQVAAPQGVVMGVAASRGREDGAYMPDRMAGVQSSHTQAPFQQAAEFGQPSSGSFNPQGGAVYAWSSGPARYGAGQVGGQHGRRSSGAGAGGSSGGASDELERMMYSQVEGLSMQGANVGTRACFSPQKRMSMAEMRSYRVGATGSSGSG